MRTTWLAAGLLALSACSTLNTASLFGAPKSLDEIHGAPDWRQEKGETLAKNYQRDMSAWARGRPLAALRSELVAAQFDCADGGLVCSRMFATRACQTDWTVKLPATSGRKLIATFERDCVGRDDDWPEPKNSAIDDQLAPLPPPTQ